MRGIRYFIPIVALAWCAGLSAQTAPSATASGITNAPTIDGLLDEAVWGQAAVLSGFVQREPTEGQPVSERTEIRVMYDDNALYIGAWLFDRDPSSLVLGQTIRDASVNDRDAFLVALDTYRDRQNGFVFGTTPSGLEYDGQFSNEGQGGGSGRRASAGNRPGPAEAST